MSHYFNTEKIRKESEAVLVKQGLAAEDAALLVDTMLEADMAGIPTHGIRMLPAYIEKIGNGFFSLEKPEILKSTASFAVVDARGSIGALSADFCTNLAVEGAKRSGIYTVLSRNCNTFGAASYFTNAMAEQGLIGVAFSNSPAAMPVANGAKPMLGTNPLAFSCPSKSKGSIMFDMATSVVAKSKFEMYRQDGKPLPDEWALDTEGNPTNDPIAAIKGLVLPMAGFKGYNIAMMIDIISGALSGAAYLDTVNKFYSGTNTPMNVGQTFIAIDPSVVYGDEFLNLMDQYIERVRESKAADGKIVIVPGDRRRTEKMAAKEHGIRLTDDSVNKLVKILVSGNAAEIDFREQFGKNEVGSHEED